MIQYDHNPPTIFVGFDDPCFMDYPANANDTTIDLYASVTTDSDKRHFKIGDDFLSLLKLNLKEFIQNSKI